MVPNIPNLPGSELTLNNLPLATPRESRLYLWVAQQQAQNAFDSLTLVDKLRLNSREVLIAAGVALALVLLLPPRGGRR